jgi:hypothetical protein
VRGLITAGIRVIIIFSFLQALIILINNIYIFWSGDYTPTKGIFNNILILSIAFLIIFLILWVIWWKAGSVATFLAGNIDENQLVINASNTDLIKTIMRVLGICLIFLTLPTLLGHIAFHIVYKNINSDGIHQANEIMWWVTDGARLFIGVWLMLGGRGIINAINTIWDTSHTTGKKDNTDNIDNNAP